MGIWGRITAPFRGRPSKPTPKPYTPDPYFDSGPGRQRTFGADELAYNALQRLSERPDGFTDAELRNIWMPGNEQINLDTAAALRRSSRGAAAGGAFGSGGKVRGEGEIMSKGAVAKGMNRWRAQALQAQTALQDRYNKIAAYNQYTQPRLGLMGQAHGRQLGYDEHLNNLAYQQWLASLGQYNKEFDWGWNRLTNAGSGILDWGSVT